MQRYTIFASLLKKFRQRSEYTKTTLAREIRVTPSYMIGVENGQKQPPTFEKCRLLADLLKLNAKEKWEFYLAALQERMSRKSENEFIKALNESKTNILPPHFRLGKGHYRQVPVISWEEAYKIDAKANHPLAFIKTPVEFVHTELEAENIFALKILNDEMEPQFLEGDIITIELNISVKNNDFVVVKDKKLNKAILRQYKTFGNQIVLHPLNQKYEDLMERDPKGHKVIGKVRQKAQKKFE